MDMRAIHSEAGHDQNRGGKLIAGLVVAIGLLGLGWYGYTQGLFRADPVPYSALPNPGAPLVH